MTAMKTTPAASETWTTDIGASARAPTCRPQLAVAVSMPSVNELGGVQGPDRAQRVQHLDLGHRVGALVLVEEAQVRHEGASEGEEYSEV